DRRRSESGQGCKEGSSQSGGFAKEINEERLRSPDVQNASGDFLVVAALVPSACSPLRCLGQAPLHYLRRPLPPRIPPRIPRTSCRPIWLLAARIALLAIE